MGDERSELGRRLAQLRWDTAERRAQRVERLAEEVRQLDPVQREQLEALVEKP
jgi:hypothetical protein